jgi:lipid-A-disaccharide synthase
MKKLDGPATTYVGHPALEYTSFRQAQPERGPLLLLPGSRAGELRRHLPLMEKMATAFRRHPRVTGFVLPTPRHTEPQVLEAITQWREPVFVTSTGEGKRKAFTESIAAVAVSGTVTLELALSGIPMAITYVGDRGQTSRWRKHKPRFVGLPNILFGSDLVPERLGGEPQPEALIADIEHLLDDPAAADRQLAGFARIRTGMERGAPETPLEDAVDRILAHLPQRSEIGT